MADLFLKHRCGYCQDEIFGIRVRCCVCADYEICLQCFSLGCEAGPHKNIHGYKLIDPGTFSVFPKTDDISCWSAREDYQLLDAIEQFGYGNWEDVAKHVETRNADESKERYCEKFVNGTIGKSTWLGLPNGTLANGEVRLSATDHTCPNNAPLSPSITSRLPPLAIQPDEILELGYMPQRDDFEREHDNDAETIISHLVIHHDDDDIDLALKLAQVDMYTRRLRERARRKRVARDFQLVSQFFSNMKKEKEKPPIAAKKKESAKEKEMQEKFRPFTQFHTATEHEQFLRSLAKERALRLRIRELMKYRRNGLTRHEDCIEYERLRYFRERRKEARLERQRRKSGTSGPGPIAQNPGTLPKSDSDRNEAPASSCREGKSISFISTNVLSDANSRPRHGLVLSASTSYSQAEWQEAVANHIAQSDDLGLCPGSELLSHVEKQICQSLHLRPLYYTSLKTNLILNGADKQSLMSGLVSEEQTLIINHFHKAGYLSVP